MIILKKVSVHPKDNSKNEDQHKKTHSVLSFVVKCVIWVLFLSTLVFVHNYSIKIVREEENKIGYSRGWQAGTSNGWDAGYAEGLAEGMSVGFDAGWSNGHEYGSGKKQEVTQQEESSVKRNNKNIDKYLILYDLYFSRVPEDNDESQFSEWIYQGSSVYKATGIPAETSDEDFREVLSEMYQ